jgi:hypothetical protein
MYFLFFIDAYMLIYFLVTLSLISKVLSLATIDGSLFSEVLSWATSCEILGLLVLLGSGRASNPYTVKVPCDRSLLSFSSYFNRSRPIMLIEISAYDGLIPIGL